MQFSECAKFAFSCTGFTIPRFHTHPRQFFSCSLSIQAIVKRKVKDEVIGSFNHSFSDQAT